MRTYHEAFKNASDGAPLCPVHQTQMILNHKFAFDTILAHPPKPNHLTTNYIRELHQTLIQKLEVSAGLRNHPVGITGSQYLPLDNEWQIKESLDQTIDLINQTKDPYAQALIAICMISYIQPFADGNKRTARMLGNALLISQNLLPISYRTVSEVAYKDALIVFYEQNTLAPLKQIFIDQVIYANQTYFRIKDNV